MNKEEEELILIPRKEKIMEYPQKKGKKKIN